VNNFNQCDVVDDVGCDKLNEMFNEQRKFMELLVEKRGFPKFPLDLSKKLDQKFCKQIVYEVMGELFEVVQELRSSKDHRITELSHDSEKICEELVDALHYYFELCILMNITPKELFDSYMKKGKINSTRIHNGY